jgi:PAS domain S-box-containing protein
VIATLLTEESLALLDHVADGVAVTRADGKIAYCSRPLAAMLGHQAKHTDAISMFGLVQSTGQESLATLHERALASGLVQRALVRCNVNELQARVVMRRAIFQDVRCVVWSFEDTSDNRDTLPDFALLATAIEQDRGRLDLAAQRTDFGFWDVEVETDELTWWNDWCLQRDIDPCSGAGHGARWDATIHPEDLAGTNGYQDVIAGRTEIYEAEFRVRTRSGDWLWISSRGMATARNADGKALRIAGVTIDIDARKRTALALRESEVRLEAVVWGTEIGLWEVRADGTCWWFNDWCELHGIEPYDNGRGARTWLERIHPADAPLYERLSDEATRGVTDHYVIEFRIKARDGGWRWVLERGRVTQRDAAGAYLVMVGVCLDIDERKQMQAALREAEQRYEIAVDAAHLPVWELDLRTGNLRANAHWHSALGYEPGQTAPYLTPDGWRADVHPEDLPRIAHLLDTPNANRTEFFELELRVRTRTGLYKWFIVRGRVVEADAVSKAQKIVGISLDIDARKRMEIAVRESEARLATILQTMREGVVLVNGDGQVEFTNPAFDRMFGHGDAGVTNRWLARFSARGGTRTINFRRADGGEFSGEILTGSIAVSGSKKTLYVIQDVSERKQLEKEITEITHRERRRLGSDLHDGLGQELTGIALLLRGVARRGGTGAGQTQPELDDIIALVNHAIQTTRTMAMGLSPVTLERGGIAAALGTLAAWARSTLGCDVRLRHSTAGALGVDEAAATHLYLIAQEAIMNAAKHGRAGSILVSLSTASQGVNLVISDDGIGIGADPGGGAAMGRGMGLKIMQYRVGILGGSLQVKRRKGGGTRVHCICPLGRRSVDSAADAVQGARAPA